MMMMMMTKIMMMMTMMKTTSLAPEYPRGVVSPKPESTLSIGTPLLDGIASLVIIISMMVMVIMLIMVIKVIMVIMVMLKMMMRRVILKLAGCVTCTSVRMVNGHLRSLLLITLGHGPGLVGQHFRRGLWNDQKFIIKI